MRHQPIPEYQKPLPFPPFPTSKWFLAAYMYVRDVWSRMDNLLAAATSKHGSILKIDSTKKICNKLQGADANSASWATNVGRNGSSWYSKSTSIIRTKAITKDEMARHCKRRTRGIKQTTEAIEALLLSFSMVTDTLGVPLLKEEIKSIWEEQQKHVVCIQDPTGEELYTVTGQALKGGVMLPVLRCARGSTSLESFHLHLARFVPGSSTGAINFQAYILDGITRWNAARSASAVQVNKDETLRTFNTRLQCARYVHACFIQCTCTCTYMLHTVFNPELEFCWRGGVCI